MARFFKKKRCVLSSVTRLSDFWKFLPTNFLTKEPQIFGDFLDNLEN